MQNNNSRLGKIGASEISGVVKEYVHTLFQRKLIDEETYTKIIMMPDYLDTRYSIAKKHSLTEEQLEKFSKFIENDAMRRGKACEEMVLEQFLSENAGFKVISSQVRKEINLENCDIPLIATIDYILENNGIKYLLECKTTDISIFYKIEQNGIPFNYYLQTQQQMYLHGIDKCFVMIAGVQTISQGRGQEKRYEILETETEMFKLDKEFVENAIFQAVSWFDWEMKNNKEQILAKDKAQKIKADIEIDDFLADLEATRDIRADEDLATQMKRYFELKPILEEAKVLEKEIESFIRENIGTSKKLNLLADNIGIAAKFTNPSFMDEIDLVKNVQKKADELEKAKGLEVGAPKSNPKLLWGFIG